MRKYTFIVVFVSGMVSLAVEMAASRLLGNYFGTSNLVWASIIGLILIYLTAGYFIGGTWADRSPHYSTFFKILAWAALSVGLIPLVSRPILRIASNAFDNLQLGVLAGSFTSVMILFIIPVTLLGMASPFAIRLSMVDTDSSGKISGRIYAISTLGSFLGTFLPVLVLIPLVGTYHTFLIISATLMFFALIGIFLVEKWNGLLRYIWMPIAIVLLFFVGTPGTDKTSKGLIYEGESSYNYIQVLKEEDFTLLRLNEGQGVHSIYSPNTLNYHGTWEKVIAAPFFNVAPVSLNKITSASIVGLAAGTTSRELFAIYPNIRVDGIEIDPLIVNVGLKYFAMDNPALNIIIQDGRWALQQSTKKYDIISIDAYRPPYIPWQMTTQEFFKIVYDHLDSKGVMVINIGRGPTDRRLVDALAATIQTVFPTIYISDVASSFNTLLYATVQQTNIDNYLANYVELMNDMTTPPLLLEVMAEVYEGLQPIPPLDQTQVFTDDRAPVEQITNSIVINFFISGETQTLQ